MLDYIPTKYCDKMIEFNENKKQFKNFLDWFNDKNIISKNKLNFQSLN